MIVFNFGPLSKNELTIRFDAKGAAKFLSAIADISKGEGEGESIIIDCFQYSRRTIVAARIEIKKEDKEKLEMSDGRLALGMSDEAFEYAEFLLEKFIKIGGFSPSEFYGFSRKNRKCDTQVFFVKFSSNELVISSNGIN
jgi:hypothetical protein